ncbi:hypothetical protein U1Q18_051280, partial [Sarracenia purpurea var. burkii]
MKMAVEENVLFPSRTHLSLQLYEARNRVSSFAFSCRINFGAERRGEDMSWEERKSMMSSDDDDDKV